MTSPIRVPTLPGHDFNLPPRLEGLGELAYNLWWCWTPRAQAIFSRIDHVTWSRSRNAIPVLTGVTEARWAELASDEDFMVDASRALDDFGRYMADGRESWFGARGDGQLAGPVAYFCAEYGFHESMQIYSGGLGVLAGDHCKSASDAGLPFVGVGLLYRRGYFRQQIDADGHQEHAQPDLDPARLPLRRARGAGGAPLDVQVDLPGRVVHAAVWVAQVGRVPILLLDTDVPANDPADRPITHILYVRGREMRLSQEIVLGIGGVRALEGLEIDPAVWHLNEGHSAFLLLERARKLMTIEPGLAARDALRRVGRDAVLTIHTPVPAGNEAFGRDQVARHLAPWFEATGMEPVELAEMGRGRTDEPDAPFDMTAFVLRHASGANAVSQLHARTATEAWEPIAGYPIRPITNGVHVATWLGGPVRRRLEHVVGATLGADVAGPEHLTPLEGFDDAELWAAHQQQKRELVNFVEGRLLRQFARHGESPDALRAIRNTFDLDVLTIGFARRFATYKRAALLFTDEDRLSRILSDAERPVQVVIAGKAHPADRPGQQVIEHIFRLSRSDRLRGHVVMIEDYDMRIARFLIGGVDLWLNNPRRPMEASGTSGMKAAINGVPSLSILDGWWDEGYTGRNGWAIGSREPGDGDDTRQDQADAQELYRLLEDEIVPCYYERDAAGIPRAWLPMMRDSIRSALWQYSTARMLAEYLDELYLPAVRSMEPAPAR
jgi:glycogen phosphorylase